MNRRGPAFICLTVAIGLLALAAFCQRAESADTVRVAGIVLKWVRGDKEANLRRAEPLIREAARHGAKIVCTTECFLDGYAIADKSIPLETYRALGESIPDGPYYKRLARLADELDIHLIAGMLEADGTHRYNTAVLIDPAGKLAGKYHKQKLGHEIPRNKPGDVSSVFQTPCGKIGVMICADRTEPGIVLNYCVRGADFLICPSGGMFGPVKNDPILAARSRENGVSIVFVHPTEFLVTEPAGEIVTAELFGDRLLIEPDDQGSKRDSSAVRYVDLLLDKHVPQVNAIKNGDFGAWPDYSGQGVTTNGEGVRVDSIPTYWWGAPGAGATATYDVVNFPSGQSDVPGNPLRHLRVRWHKPPADDSSGETYHQPQFRLTFLENSSINDVRRFEGQTVAVSFYARVAQGTADVIPIMWHRYDDQTPDIAQVKGKGFELFESSGEPGIVAIAQGAPRDAARCHLTDEWQRFEKIITLPSTEGKRIKPPGYTGVGFDLAERTAETIDLANVAVHLLLDHGVGK